MKNTKTLKKSAMLVLAVTTTMGLAACGDDAKNTTTPTTSHVAADASLSATSSKPAEPSYMKNGKVNPLAVTRDSVNEVCTKLLGDPSKTYAHIDAYKTDFPGEPSIDTIANSHAVNGWVANVTKAHDGSGNYVSFTCTPGTDGSPINKPGIMIAQYTDGSGVQATDPTERIGSFTKSDYARVVNNKVIVRAMYDMGDDFTSVNGQTRAKKMAENGQGFDLSRDNHTITLSPAETAALVNKWSAKRVAIIKPFVDNAADGIIAG